MPAKAGIQSGGLNNLLLGPRFRGDDEKVGEDGTISAGLEDRPLPPRCRFDLGLALAHLGQQTVAAG